MKKCNVMLLIVSTVCFIIFSTEAQQKCGEGGAPACVLENDTDKAAAEAPEGRKHGKNADNANPGGNARKNARLEKQDEKIFDANQENDQNAEEKLMASAKPPRQGGRGRGGKGGKEQDGEAGQQGGRKHGGKGRGRKGQDEDGEGKGGGGGGKKRGRKDQGKDEIVESPDEDGKEKGPGRRGKGRKGHGSEKDEEPEKEGKGSAGLRKGKGRKGQDQGENPGQEPGRKRKNEQDGGQGKNQRKRRSYFEVPEFIRKVCEFEDMELVDCFFEYGRILSILSIAF